MAQKLNLTIGLSTCLLLHSTRIFASENFNEIKRTVEDKYVQATAINALLPQLQSLESKVILNKDSQQVVKDIFLNTSLAYARLFHFRQAYYAYQGYLNLKEKYDALEKQKAIDSLVSEINEKQKEFDSNLLSKKNSLNQLQLDIESWETMNGKFARNYSLAIILFTAILAIIFIRINIATVKAKKALTQSRDELKRIQRLAMLGAFYEGIKKHLASSSEEITLSTQTQQSELLGLDATESGNIDTQLEKVLKDISSVEKQIKSVL